MNQSSYLGVLESLQYYFLDLTLHKAQQINMSHFLTTVSPKQPVYPFRALFVKKSYLGHKLLNPEGGTFCSESVNTPPGLSV